VSAHDRRLPPTVRSASEHARALLALRKPSESGISEGQELIGRCLSHRCSMPAFPGWRCRVIAPVTCIQVHVSNSARVGERDLACPTVPEKCPSQRVRLDRGDQRSQGHLVPFPSVVLLCSFTIVLRRSSDKHQASRRQGRCTDTKLAISAHLFLLLHQHHPISPPGMLLHLPV
jgi:hypothetical protein